MIIMVIKHDYLAIKERREDERQNTNGKQRLDPGRGSAES